MVTATLPPNQDFKTQIKSALDDPNISEDGFETSKVFALIAVLLQEKDGTSSSLQSRSFPSIKKLVKIMNTCYQFVIKNKSGKEVLWYVDMRKTGRVAKGKAPFKSDVTIWCSDSDLVALASGEMNPQKLYAANRIKVKGNIDKALKIQRILSHEREKILLAGHVRSFLHPPRSSMSSSKPSRASHRSKL